MARFYLVPLPAPIRVGVTCITQWPVAAGLGAVCNTGTLLMSQRHPLHIAEEVRTALMASLTPARAITLTVVVIHPLSRKAGRARVAGVAFHAGAGKQLRLIRDVIAWRDLTGSTLNMATGVGATARGDTGMIKRAIGERCITRMALIARRRGGYVQCRRLSFAQHVQRGVSTVVAGFALTGDHALGGGVRKS